MRLAAWTSESVDIGYNLTQLDVHGLLRVSFFNCTTCDDALPLSSLTPNHAEQPSWSRIPD